MLDEMTQHVRERKLAGKNAWSPTFDKFFRKLEAYGIFVGMPAFWRTPNEKLHYEVMRVNLFLQHYPECEIYEPVLRFFQF